MLHLYKNQQWSSILNVYSSKATAMRTHLQYRRHSSAAFLSALLLLTFDLPTSFASSSEQTTSFEQLFSTDPNNATFTPLCDDGQLRNVAQQVAQLKISTENIFLLLDSNKLRMDYIKKLLDERLPEVKYKPHWVDVRGGESISSTHVSTRGSTHVVFPSLSTQFFASIEIIPVTSSQSSAGVVRPQSPAGGVNIPATDLESFIGEAYLPVIGPQSSESVAEVSSLSTDSPSSCICHPQI